MSQRVRLPDGRVGVFPDDMDRAAIEAVLQKQFGPPKSPTTQSEFTALAESLPKGSKEREDALNMAVRLSEPAAAGAALTATSMIPMAAMGIPRALMALVGAGLGGHVGKFLGGGIPIPGATKVGEVVGSVGGGLVGGVGGVGAIRSLAEGVPGYSGHLARALLKTIGAGRTAAATPVVASAEEALLAQAMKQYPQLSREALLTGIRGGAGSAAPAAVSVAAPAAEAAATPVATALTKEQARAKLEQLLANAVNEGQTSAAAQAKKYMAELGHLQGEGVIAP